MAMQTTRSPVDGSIVATRPLADAVALDAVLQRAADAAPGWRDTPLVERCAHAEGFVAAMLADIEPISRELTMQMGRPLRYSPGEIRGLAERATTMIQLAPQALADIQVPGKPGFTRFIRREPVGVSLVLAPWNYPYLTAVNAVVPAILAGNPVVLKHSDQTPLVAERFATAWEAADLPCGVVAETEGGSPETSRYDLIQSTCDIVGEDHVIVGTTGKTGRELFTCRDSANHLYMVGSMGCAASFGLGLALQLPADRKVIVIDGDGAALMRLEALVTIGHIRPGNLIHLILDNHAYDSTGGQRTLSASVRLDRIAQACGYPYAVSVTGRARFEQELHQAMAEDGPHLIHARITPGSLGDLARPDIKPHEVKARLMDYLGTTRNDV